MPKPIANGKANEPRYFRQQRDWARDVNRELAALRPAVANNFGGGQSRSHPIPWKHDYSFRGEFKHRAEYTSSHSLVIEAGNVIFPSNVTTISAATISLPVSGNLYVYVTINPITRACSVTSNATQPNNYVSDTERNVIIGKITETNTGIWSWTQWRKGDIIMEIVTAYGVDAGGAWVSITGEPTSGNYSFSELDRDASTATGVTKTGKLQEVSGRYGIKDGSKVWAWPDSENGNYKCEYHGAPDGTIKTLASGSATSANSDTWDRAAQGSTFGEKERFVARLAVNQSTGGLYSYSRNRTSDANGHHVLTSAESEQLHGYLTLSSTISDVWKKCSDDTIIAYYEAGDSNQPSGDYALIYYSGAWVEAYRDGTSANASTNLPSQDMATVPASCSDVTLKQQFFIVRYDHGLAPDSGLPKKGFAIAQGTATHPCPRGNGTAAAKSSAVNFNNDASYATGLTQNRAVGCKLSDGTVYMPSSTTFATRQQFVGVDNADLYYAVAFWLQIPDDKTITEVYIAVSSGASANDVFPVDVRVEVYNGDPDEATVEAAYGTTPLLTGATTIQSSDKGSYITVVLS